MRSLQYLNAHYNHDKSISLYCTDGTKTHKLKIVGFRPYFYVPISDPIPSEDQYNFNIQAIEVDPNPNGDGTGEFLHEDGFPVKKIVVSSPDVVHSKTISIRDKFSAHYEADVKFIRRFLIDTGIHSQFVIMSDNLTRPIHYSELIPAKLEEENKIPLHIAYIDFEIDCKSRFANAQKPTDAITAWTLYSSKTKEYLTAVLSDKDLIENWTPNHIVIYCATEEILLGLFAQILEDIQPHLIAYWYGKIADRDYPRARALTFGIKIPYHHSDELDLCHAYQLTHNRLFTYLKGVAVEEQIFKPSEIVAEHYHKDMWKKDPKKFIAYNKMDVEIMVALDETGWYVDEFVEDISCPHGIRATGNKVFEPPRELCQFFWDLRNFVGVEECKAAMHNSVLVDTLILREANGKVILNSGHSDIERGEREPSFTGATVFDPVEGILPFNQDEVIAVLDYSRYYPNLFLGYHIDDLGCKVILKLSNLRDHYELEMKNSSLNSPEYQTWEKKRDKIKFLLNSVWAYYGCTWVRKYVQAKAEKIAAKGRLGLQIVKDAIEAKTLELLGKLREYVSSDLEKGFVVAFGDTDSTGVIIKPNLIGRLIWYLNEIVLKEHCKNEMIPPLLKLAHEKTASKGIFVKAKGHNRAAKKRRAMRIKWQKGRECDFIEIKGFDTVRNNCSNVTRKLLMKEINEILKGDKTSLPTYIRNLIKEIKEGKYLIEDLAIPVTLSKPIEQYGGLTKDGNHAATPDYVTGAKWSIANLGLEIIGGDRVKVLYCLRPTKVISYLDEETLPKDLILDYETIIEKEIKQKSIQFLKLAGISWGDVIGHSDFGRWFK